MPIPSQCFGEIFLFSSIFTFYYVQYAHIFNTCCLFLFVSNHRFCPAHCGSTQGLIPFTTVPSRGLIPFTTAPDLGLIPFIKIIAMVCPITDHSYYSLWYPPHPVPCPFTLFTYILPAIQYGRYDKARLHKSGL